MPQPDEHPPGENMSAPGTVPRDALSWVEEVQRADPAPLIPPARISPARISPARDAADLRSSEPLQPSAAPELRPSAQADEWTLRDPGLSAAAAAGLALPTFSPEQVAGSSLPRADYSADHSANPYTELPSDTGQKKLIAGLLAIVFGALGVHKFYLGLNTPGAIVLGAQVGGWILAFFLGLITFGIGLFVTLPIAILCSSALGLLGLVEGLLYLTKSDEDFHRQYVLERRPLL